MNFAYRLCADALAEQHAILARSAAGWLAVSRRR
jgi:hypothetical protein